METTTVAGDEFVKSPLGFYKPKNKKTVGLPGLGEVASTKLSNMGIEDAAAVFWKFMSLNRDRKVFLDYLEKEVGVTFVGNDKFSKEDYKVVLCDTLEAKWNIIKQY